MAGWFEPEYRALGLDLPSEHAARYGYDGAAYAAALIFGLLGRPARAGTTAALLARAVGRRGVREVAAFGADALAPLRTWLEQGFGSELVRALIAPWVLHVGLGPEANLSALMAKVIFYTLDAVGLPFVEGGGGRLVQALTAMVQDGGGQVLTGADVDEVIVVQGRARAVRTTAGETYAARRAVVCNVTPTQLYGRLLRDLPGAKDARRRAQAY